MQRFLNARRGYGNHLMYAILLEETSRREKLKLSSSISDFA